MTTSFASASDLREQKPRLVELASNVYGYISEFDPNCGFIVGDDSVLAIDTRATPQLAREWLADIRTITDKPVRHIFLTHYHAVRVLGAAAFGESIIVASRATNDWICERGEADFRSETGRFPRLFSGVEEVPGLTYPHVTFEREMSLWFGNREIRFMHLGRGHSNGDSVCWLPDCGVLFSGDLVENHCGVYTGDAYLRDWTVTLEHLRSLGATTTVPGRGAALRSREDVHAAIDSTRDFISTLLDAVSIGLREGCDLKDCHALADAAMRPKFGDWPIYQHVLAFDVSRAYDELTGIEHPRVWTAERDQALWNTLHN
jgi:glyoxylase-like metal-dependent hydrolase (beta-lactamase superfamily II)